LRAATKTNTLGRSMEPQAIAVGVIWYIAFLFSTVCHESAHALAAKWGGDLTAFHGGQASLNPIPHIRREPFGTVVVPIISYLLAGWMIGWASAPYNPAWQQQYPKRAAWMALAGPGANFLLMFGAAGAIRVGIATGAFHAPQSLSFTRITEASAPGLAGFAATLLSILFVLNLLLGTFNLLPVPPLDGSTGITVLMRESAALRFLHFTRNRTFALIGVFLAWTLFNRIFPHVFLTAVNLLYPGLRYGS
jgi:Zn-dependent protease